MAFFRTSGRIRREAADWLARLGAGADGESHAAFRRWYEADRRHAEAYDRMAAIWSGASQISASPGPATTHDTTRRSSRRTVGLAIAACLIGGIALALVLLLGPRWLPDSANQHLQSFATAIGEIREIALPDGSQLVLDSSSRVEARFTDSERVLTLTEGRARFIVAHESRPFIVRAASNEVVATGTIFDVSLIQSRLAVVLIEGTVEVRQRRGGRSGGAQRLDAGQRLVISGEAAAVRQRATRGETLWPTRMLEFDNTPLQEAVVLVNRYSRVQLRLGDARIGDLRVSGAYRAGDVMGFARSLATAFSLSLETQSDGSLLLVDPRSPR
jgi:transmembrane sensor